MDKAQRIKISSKARPLQGSNLPEFLRERLKGPCPLESWFTLREIKALTRGKGRRLIDDQVYAGQRCGFGEYLESVLVQLGWWMSVANDAASDLLHNRPNLDCEADWAEEKFRITRQLRRVRLAFGEVLAIIPAAWDETYVQSPTDPDSLAAAHVLIRYLEFRSLVCGLAKDAWPGVDLAAVESRI